MAITVVIYKDTPEDRYSLWCARKGHTMLTILQGFWQWSKHAEGTVEDARDWMQQAFADCDLDIYGYDE